MKKKRIVYLGVTASYSHTMPAYGCLRAWCDTFSTEPELDWQYFETTINDDAADMASRLILAETDILLATAYMFNQSFLMSVINRFNAMRPECRIYLGGPQFDGDNEMFLRRHPAVSGVVRGDESSADLLIAGAREVPGLCYLNAAGEYRDHGRARMSIDAASLPSPWQSGYFVPGKPFYQIETSRGCGGTCSFCTSSHSSGVIRLPLERIRGDIRVAAGAGAAEIRILDRTFNESESRAMELLAMFRDEFPRLRFHLEINPAAVTPSLLEIMSSFPPGYLHLEAGIQTFSAGSLRAVRRPASPARTLAGVRSLTGCGNLAVHADLIAGLPQQRFQDVLDDLDVLIDAAPEEIQLEILKILPGTPLATAIPEGMVYNPEPPYEVLRSNGFSSDELRRVRIISAMIDNYYNVERLRRLFVHGWKFSEGFAARFTKRFDSETVTGRGRPSPQRRLEIMENYARDTGDKRLEELVKFTWLASGMSAEKYRLKIYRRDAGALPEGKIIYEKTIGDTGIKRFFTASFPYRAAVLFENGHGEAEPGQFTYVFGLVHGQNTGCIIEL